MRIEGEHIAVRIVSDGPDLFRKMAEQPFTDHLTLDESEAVDVVQPGSCLIESSDGTRHFVSIQSGRISGPAKVMQVFAEPPRELLNAEIRRQASEADGSSSNSPARSKVSGKVMRALFAAGSTVAAAAVISYPFFYEMPVEYQAGAFCLGALNVLAAVFLVFGKPGDRTEAQPV